MIRPDETTQFRRFLHLIHDDGTDHWQELRPDEVEFSIMRTDIHCIYATPHGDFDPDHCPFCEVRYLDQNAEQQLP